MTQDTQKLVEALESIIEEIGLDAAMKVGEARRRDSRLHSLLKELRAALASGDHDPLYAALKKIRESGYNEHPTTAWMQKVAAHAMEPHKWPAQPDHPPDHYHAHRDTAQR